MIEVRRARKANNVEKKKSHNNFEQTDSDMG